jgi:hypothetical protein
MSGDYGYEMEAIEAERLDADLLQDRYERESARAERLRAAGVCLHSSAVGYLPGGEHFYTEQIGLEPGQIRCTEGCLAVFADDAAYSAAMRRAYGSPASRNQET